MVGANKRNIKKNSMPSPAEIKKYLKNTFLMLPLPLARIFAIVIAMLVGTAPPATTNASE